MTLQDLPNELLIRIAEAFPHPRDVFSLLQTNQRFARVLIPVLNVCALTSGNAMAALFWAAASQQMPMVKLLLEQGRHVEVVMKHPDDWMKRTLVHKGPGKCTQKEIDFVLKQGPDLILRGAHGASLPALHYAIRNGHKALFRLLMEKGAVVGATDDFDLSPLHEASWLGNEDFVRLLLERGADVGARDFMGRTPLHMAVEYRHLGTVKLLFDKGADVDVHDGQNRTPLHLAVKDEDEEMILWLVREGADIDAPDHLWRTPHDMASSSILPMMTILSIVRFTDEERYGLPNKTLWQNFPVVLRRLKKCFEEGYATY